MAHTYTAWICKQPGMTAILAAFTDGETEAVWGGGVPTLGTQLEIEARIAILALVASLTRPVGPGSSPHSGPHGHLCEVLTPSLSMLQVELTSSKWMQSYARR